MRVIAAMSGGVDSAVAAARARDAGHDVTGVHLALSPSPARAAEGARGCCTLDDARDARRAADALGIPFYVWDLAARFGRDVVDDFVETYARGETPNPCLRCNERIKFAAVLDRARALGFDAVVTGHYARLVDVAGGVGLARAADPGKDQSYVLGTLRRDQWERAIFPLGDSQKSEVRAEAATRGLAVADKRDSSDICFIPQRDTAGWLRNRLGEQPGSVVDATTGREVGRHDGAYAFTVGQRRGLDLSVPAADGRPRFVLGVEPAARRVVVGPRELLATRELAVSAPVWNGIDAPAGELRCRVQLQAHGGAVAATAVADASGIALTFDEPVRRPAPGQAAVLYDEADVRVLGAGRVAAGRVVGDAVPDTDVRPAGAVAPRA
jgi:tRNA-specific 2-thiouridylase